jgi:CAAX protease family protein
LNRTPNTSQTATTASSLTFPIIGVLTAIAATTTLDATGLFLFSALALLPLMLLFWYLDRLPRTSMGFKWGRSWGDYALAILYPVIVIGAVAIIAAFAGAIDTSKTNWYKALFNLGIMTISTFLVAMITEEGFFRGWLWGSLRQKGVKQTRVLIWSSIAFALWHIPAVALDTDFQPSLSQIPIFLINAAIMGVVWGLLRAISGSVIVASLSHGLWNGVAYIFFGFGTRLGALGITNTALFGPEIGILGLVINLAFALLLWRWWKARGTGASRD